MTALRVISVAAPDATDECLSCGTPIPARRTWCSWPCRSLDDRHDTYDDVEMGDDDA